jgi:hypothetical protein
MGSRMWRLGPAWFMVEMRRARVRIIRRRGPALPFLYPLAIEGTAIPSPETMAYERFFGGRWPFFCSLLHARFMYVATAIWMPELTWLSAWNDSPDSLFSALPADRESDVRWLMKGRRRTARRYERQAPPGAWPPHRGATLLPLHGLNPDQCEEKR